MFSRFGKRRPSARTELDLSVAGSVSITAVTATSPSVLPPTPSPSVYTISTASPPLGSAPAPSRLPQADVSSPSSRGVFIFPPVEGPSPASPAEPPRPRPSPFPRYSSPSPSPSPCSPATPLFTCLPPALPPAMPAPSDQLPDCPLEARTSSTGGAARGGRRRPDRDALDRLGDSTTTTSSEAHRNAINAACNNNSNNNENNNRLEPVEVNANEQGSDTGTGVGVDTGADADTLAATEAGDDNRARGNNNNNNNNNVTNNKASSCDRRRKTGIVFPIKTGVIQLPGRGGDPPDLLDVAAPAEGEAMPVIRKKERDYMGMFEYDRRDEMQIIRVLIYELKPRVAVTFLPGLPAYILFMCIRHTDHINDDEKVRSLLNNIVNGVKRVIKKRHEDLDSTVLWLSNTLRLLHNLKQYSGDKAFQAENTVKQNEQSLKNFDLSEYRQVLSDIAVWIYNGVIKLMEEKVQPLIVPSILEHEAIAGLSGNKPGGMRGRAGSVARELESPVEPQKALDLLLKEMTQFYRTLAMFGTDPELITQVFRQIFYFICAGSLNNLLLRKDMCHWSKGMQIRYNLSHLEQWTRDMRLHEAGVTDTLAPIIQAAQLLQARKTDDDVNSICDMCDKLSVSQIIKILNLYTPADEFEERVPISFIHKIQNKLQERAEGEQAQATLLMNTKFAFPVRFPFNPSSIHLEDIELPESLNLIMLKKV